MKTFLKGKNILITGGTGSFGSSFVKKILTDYSDVGRLVIFSRDELKQSQMMEEIYKIKKSKRRFVRFFLGDVRDKDRLKTAFNNIDIVVHAAALKQVPAAEYNPFEFIKTNIIGSENIIEAALQSEIKNIIAQEKTAIGENETAGELHDKLMNIGSSLVLKTVQDIENESINSQAQNEDQELKEAFKIFKPFCKIDWNKPMHQIHNHVRGLSPYPTAWTEFKHKETEEVLSCKIFRTEKIEEQHQHNNGDIIVSKKELKIAVNEGFLNIKELQLAGKKRMDIVSLLNGVSFENYSLVS